MLSGKYPISRYLYVYYNAAPGKPMDPLVREFLRYSRKLRNRDEPPNTFNSDESLTKMSVG